MTKLYEKGKSKLFLEEEVRRSDTCLFIRFQQRQAQHRFSNNKPTSEKISPKTINLSKHHLIKFQIFIKKEPKFCPIKQEYALKIKSDTIVFSRKSKLRQTLRN